MFPKNIPIDVTFDADSKSAIKNTIAARNLEIALENRFSFLPTGGSFLLRRKGRYDLTDFKNEIYAYNMAGKQKDKLFEVRSETNEWFACYCRF